MKKDLFKSAVMLGERGIFVAVNFGLFALLTRYLGPTDFGRLIFILAIFRIFETVAQFGVDALFQKIIRRQYTLANYKVAFKVRNYSSWFAAAALLAFAVFTQHGQERTVLTWFALVFFLKPWELNEAFLLVQFKHLWVAGGRLIATVLVAILQLFAIYLDAGFEIIALTYLLQFALKPIISLLTVSFLRLRTALDPIPENHQLELKALIPLALTAMVGIIFNRQDVIIIEHFLSPAHLGVYAIGIRLQTVFMNLPTSIISVFYPRMLALEDKPKAFDEMVIRVGVLLFFPAVVFATIISLFSDHFILLFGGEEFTQFSYHLGLYIWALPFYSLTVIQARLHLMRNCEVQNFINAIVGLIASLGLYLLFITTMGLKGVALGYVITRFVTIFITPVLIPRQRFFLSYLFQIIFPYSLAKQLITLLRNRNGLLQATP